MQSIVFVEFTFSLLSLIAIASVKLLSYGNPNFRWSASNLLRLPVLPFNTELLILWAKYDHVTETAVSGWPARSNARRQGSNADTDIAHVAWCVARPASQVEQHQWRRPAATAPQAHFPSFRDAGSAVALGSAAPVPGFWAHAEHLGLWQRNRPSFLVFDGAGLSFCSWPGCCFFFFSKRVSLHYISA
jgi:hypothetical protein